VGGFVLSSNGKSSFDKVSWNQHKNSRMMTTAAPKNRKRYIHLAFLFPPPSLIGVHLLLLLKAVWQIRGAKRTGFFLPSFTTLSDCMPPLIVSLL
jgi:hypothetical protein